VDALGPRHFIAVVAPNAASFWQLQLVDTLLGVVVDSMALHATDGQRWLVPASFAWWSCWARDRKMCVEGTAIGVLVAALPCQVHRHVPTSA
jgi:hypothetical protein